MKSLRRILTLMMPAWQHSQETGESETPTGLELVMGAAGEDTAVADEGVFVGKAGCVAGKPDRRSSALHLTPCSFP
jgi:hypothetical protein